MRNSQPFDDGDGYEEMIYKRTHAAKGALCLCLKILNSQSETAFFSQSSDRCDRICSFRKDAPA